jgi:pyruvate dehydrogenase (quinone)
MSDNVSEYILRRLRNEWGVNRIFGYAGDGIIGFLGAMRGEAGTDRPHFVQARHEEMAAFMACAHAKFTGEVGVCLATSGPGAIHLLNGLYDARRGRGWAATSSRRSISTRCSRTSRMSSSRCAWILRRRGTW